MRKDKLPIVEMTEKQKLCFDMLSELFCGDHHLSNIYGCGTGIEMSTSESLATYDNNKLTRLVILAHERGIRAEIKSSGPGMVKIVLHKRSGRDGAKWQKHPTMMEAIEKFGGAK